MKVLLSVHDMMWGRGKQGHDVQNQTREKWKFQVLGNKFVRKMVGCKYEMSKQFSILQYEEDCVARYH